MNIYFKGVELLEKGELATAMLEFDHCIQLDPNFAPAFFKRSHIFFRQERYAAEIGELEHCTQIEPTYLEAWLNLGHAYLAQERLEDAKRCYLKVIDLDQNHPIAHYNVGLIYFDLNKYDESAKHLKHALDMKDRLKPDLREKAQHYLNRCDSRGG
jgi:tetratricopeptide (TPR) repeat protein